MGHVRRLIVFDLDGTLIDSRRDLADAANALITERGGAPLPESAIARMVGEGAALLVRRALTAAGLPVDDRSVPRFLELYDERLVQHTRPYPGIPEALSELSTYGRLAVVTNKPLAPTRRLLDAFGFAERMAAVIGGDGPFPRKPDPASLRHLMSAHGAAPEHTVLVGDSRIDFETAQAAGTRVCLAQWGFGFEGFPMEALRGGEALVAQPSELPAAVAALLR